MEHRSGRELGMCWRECQAGHECPGMEKPCCVRMEQEEDFNPIDEARVRVSLKKSLKQLTGALRHQEVAIPKAN